MKDNPYINSYRIGYSEGDVSLERHEPEFNHTIKAKTHTVLQGETIQNIANKYYKDSGSWYLITEYNNIMDPFNELEEGLMILIP